MSARTSVNAWSSVAIIITVMTASVTSAEVKLTAADGAADDVFGASASVGDDVVVIGAVRDDIQPDLRPHHGHLPHLPAVTQELSGHVDELAILVDQRGQIPEDAAAPGVLHQGHDRIGGPILVQITNGMADEGDDRAIFHHQ